MSVDVYIEDVAVVIAEGNAEETRTQAYYNMHQSSNFQRFRPMVQCDGWKQRKQQQA